MMAEAAAYNIDRGAQIIDINMGCPAKKVCNKWAGSALMQRRAAGAGDRRGRGRRLRAARRAGDAEDAHRLVRGENATRCALARARRGGRRRDAHRARPHARAGLQGEAEYDTVAAVKAAVRDPGGRQRRHRHARRRRATCCARTGADAVMIGRAAQGRPWIFREIAHFLATGEHLRAAATCRGRGAGCSSTCTTTTPVRRVHRRAQRAQAHRLGTCARCPGGEAFRARMNRIDAARRRCARWPTGSTRSPREHERLPRLARRRPTTTIESQPEAAHEQETHRSSASATASRTTSRTCAAPSRTRCTRW